MHKNIITSIRIRIPLSNSHILVHKRGHTANLAHSTVDVHKDFEIPGNILLPWISTKAWLLYNLC